MRIAGFRGMSIRQKLLAVIMGTAAAVLLLASVAYLAVDYYRSRRDLTRDLLAQAEVVSQNLQAPIQFNDPVAARDTLQTLGVNAHIRTACVYSGADAPLFAEFRTATATQPCPPRPPADGYTFLRDRLQIVSPIMVKADRAGTVVIRSDLDLLNSRMRIQAVVVAVVLAFALGVALLLSSVLQSLVSAPIRDLARTAAAVSSRGDYSLRASRTTDDELGVLVEAFNRMLERIQLREEDLSRANDELRREVVERRRAEQERAELLVREREANRLKDEFLATLSHELRTPLNAILGWTRLLRTSVVAEENRERALEKIEKNALVQSRLVEDLLEVSRIASGKLRLELRPIDLVALTNSALESIKPAAQARGVVIEREFNGNRLPTVGDPDRLQQVLWNLVSNAVKFTPPGGTVRIALHRVDGHDEIVVSDNGIGIEPEFLPNVFDPFRQADASSTRAHGGLGLGLSIVRRLVEMHGGEVHAASEGPNHGATFTVRLPVSAAQS